MVIGIKGKNKVGNGIRNYVWKWVVIDIVVGEWSINKVIFEKILEGGEEMR